MFDINYDYELYIAFGRKEHFKYFVTKKVWME